ncbi:MAG: hypothetical protein WD065_20395 [Planctomycetaceae bacterium]
MAGWVLGSHRSGTSLLCSILRNLAASPHLEKLGPGLPTTIGNPAGYHESAALVEVNDRLLRWAGSTWDRPFIAPPAWDDPKSLQLIVRLRTSLKRHTTHEDWIDKDPRLCLTRDALCHLLLRDPAAIAVMRNPLAVANSLHKRNGFALRKGAAIWMLYNLHLFNSRSRPPETIVLFDDLVSPDEQVRLRVATDLAAFSATAAGETLTEERSDALQKRALSQLVRSQRVELVRSDACWRSEHDGPLTDMIEDIWVGCCEIIRGGNDQEMGLFLRNAWATVSPVLQPEVAIPLHEPHKSGVTMSKSLSSLRGRASPLKRQLKELAQRGKGRAATKPNPPRLLS